MPDILAPVPTQQKVNTGGPADPIWIRWFTDLRKRVADITASMNSYLVFNEIAAPSGNPDANTGWLYAKDASGVPRLYWEDDAGTVNPMVVGTGAANTFAVFSSATDLSYLAAPGADRIAFWDHSALSAAWLAPGNSITISGTTLDTIQDIRTSASPTFTGETLSSLTASTLIYSNASKAITSLANSAGYLYNNGSGVLSYSTPSVGSGTIGTIPKWATTTTLTDSAINDDSGISRVTITGRNLYISSGYNIYLNNGAGQAILEPRAFGLTLTASGGASPKIEMVVGSSTYEIQATSFIFPYLTSNALVKTDISKSLSSIANSTGYLYNNGSGTFSYVAAPAPAAHNILSAYHGDSTAASCVRGDVIVGIGASPLWTRYAISVPAANVRNVFGVDNGEVEPTWKAALDGTNPTTIAVGDSAAPGTSLIFAHRDHQHASPSTWTATAHNLLSAIHGDTTTASAVRGDLITGQGVSPKWTRLALGTSGYYLKSDGTDVVWAAVPAATPGGSDTQVQFNDGGSFGGDADFTWNKTTNTLTVTSIYNTGASGVYKIGGTTVLTIAGTSNVFLGSGAGVSTISYSVAIGENALDTATSNGSNIVAIGQNALGAGVVTGSNLIAIGNVSLLNTTSGEATVAIGVNTGRFGNVGHSVLIGDAAGMRITGTTLDSVYIGYQCGYTTTSPNGRLNVFIGGNAGGGNAGLMTSATGNVGIGAFSLGNITTAGQNMALGYYSGGGLTTGLRNFLGGYQSGFTLSTTSDNVFAGNNSGYYAAGSRSVMLGSYVGEGTVSYTSNNVVWIGYNAGNNATHTGTSNTLIIESSNSTDPLIYGTFQAHASGPTLAFNAKTITFNPVTADTDLTFNFTGTTNSGIFYWMEDEDYFKFNDSILFPDSEPLLFGTGSDMDIYYNGTDGYIRTDLVAASDLHVDCGTDKTIVLDETVWDDMLPYSINPGTGLSAMSSEDYGTTGFKFNYFKNDSSANEEIQLFFQFSHSYKTSTDIYFHLHVIPSQNGAGGNEDVEFAIEYQWIPINGTYSTTTNTTDSQVFRVGATDSNKHKIFSWDVIADSAQGISSDLMIRVRRLTKTADRVNDNYTGKVYLRFADVHFEKDTIGSRQETAK